MKITSVLPENINGLDAVLMAQIHSGVILGWKDLPVNIQKIVTWVGIEFTQPPLEKTVEVKIKIKPHERELSTSIFPTKDLSSGDTERKMSLQFRESVLCLIENEITNSQSTTKALQKLVS